MDEFTRLPVEIDTFISDSNQIQAVKDIIK